MCLKRSVSVITNSITFYKTNYLPSKLNLFHLTFLLSFTIAMFLAMSANCLLHGFPLYIEFSSLATKWQLRDIYFVAFCRCILVLWVTDIYGRKLYEQVLEQHHGFSYLHFPSGYECERMLTIQNAWRC
jgi:hypothetical protein